MATSLRLVTKWLILETLFRDDKTKFERFQSDSSNP
jgi:hypothetical protein